MSADARYLSGIGLTPVPFLYSAEPWTVLSEQDCRKLSVLVVPVTDFDT